MKKLMTSLIVSLVTAGSLASAAPATDFDTIVNSKQYKRAVSEAKKRGAIFSCYGVTEKMSSRDYSKLPGEKSIYSLVVLHCAYDPQDDLDAIQQVGLAVLGGTEVLSFTHDSPAQPD